LLPLLGIEVTSIADREELFTAWRRFIEHLAEAYPTVLVFEDLQWADEALLAFLEHLADRAEGVPLLVVGTARLDLLDHRTDYAKGLRNATPINLGPLSPDETARLVSALLETTAVPDELRQPILDRAGGNPLYAEEFVRLLRDKDLLVRKGPSWELRDRAEVLFPDSVQALIAARLDTLDPAAKSMLADASVVGKVFWAGAVAHMGSRDPGDVEETLRDLSRKELIHHERHSSIQGESEYAFWHVLARDVAYRQIPRASRASRHVAAAEWIGSMAGARIEDLADVLAFHYATALELARDAGDTEQIVRLEIPALRFLSLAGERALGLDTAAALSNLQRALDLAPPEHHERPAALVRFGKAALERGRLVEAIASAEEGIALYREMGDVAGEARAMNVLGNALLRAGDPSWDSIFATALALLEPLPPSEELAAALCGMATAVTLQGRPEAGIGYAERSLAVAKDLGLPPLARALGVRGMARCEVGDEAGLDDMRAAIDVAIEAGDGRDVGILHNNLAVELWVFEGPQAGIEVIRAGIEFAEARGLHEVVHLSTGITLLDLLVDAGRYDESIGVGADFGQRFEADLGAAYDRATVLAAQVRVWAVRGEVADVAGALDELDAVSQGTGAAQDVLIFRGSLALGRASLGEREAAASLLAEIQTDSDTRADTYYAPLLAPLVRTAIQIGELELASRFVSGLDPRHRYLEHALVAANAALTEARGDRQAAAAAYAEAAVRWEGFDVVPEQGFALLGQGRCLVGLSRWTEASPVLRHAHEIFEGLGAVPALTEIDALLRTKAKS
jgi:tetratricopeptide (TPR) repeat protein